MVMRAQLVLMGLLATGTALAAPGPGGQAPPPDRGKLREEARSFARQLHYLVAQVSEQYVRPVAAEDLYVAALTGLYQAARKTVPHDLRVQVRQASNLAAALRDRSSGDFDGRPEHDPREQMLARHRQQLGMPPALAGGNAMLAACKGLLTLLDAHSGLLTSEEQRLTAGHDQESQGVGLEFHDAAGTGPLVVDVVYLGGPAQRAGMRPGDVVSHIDDTPVTRTPPAKLLALRSQRVVIAAPPLTPGEPQGAPADPGPRSLRVTYRRPGERTDRTATLLPERFRPESVLGVSRKDDNSWNYLLDEKQKLALVRITTLSRGTADDLRTALESLRDHKMRGLVLDLRWCPGGYLQEAIEVADLFLGEGVIATEKSRGREDTVYRSTDTGKFRDFALVVLVNAETKGGAELIAAALQDHKRGVVVGQRTCGKGSVQVPLGLGIEGVVLKLTKGAFVRPSGKNLHRFPDSSSADDWGVRPDEDCRLSPELGKRLHQWHRLYALRPVTSSERLPLDDPRADTQRLTALEVLRQRLK
jgi:C-terminal processing protease CtpA/Prc